MRNIANPIGNNDRKHADFLSDKPTNVWTTVHRLFLYLKEYKISLLFVLLFSLIEVVCVSLAPYLLGLTIDDCLSGIFGNDVSVDFKKLVTMLLLLAVLYFVSAFSSWFQEYKMSVLAQYTVKKMREDLVKKIHSLDLQFFDGNMRGDTMSLFTNDVELVKDALSGTAIQLFSSILTLAGSFVIMWSLSFELMCLTCLTIPLVIMLSKFITIRTRKYFSEQQIALGHLNGMVEESICGLKTVRNFAREQQIQQEFCELNKSLKTVGTKAFVYSGILMPLMRVLDNLSYILVTVFGAILASRGSISIGMIQSFLLYAKNFQRPINSIASELNSIQSAIAGAERIFSLLDEHSEVEDSRDAVDKDIIRGEVVFDNVYFGYDKDEMILKGISFSVNPNEVIAIVGPTGAGKTTILNLLMRFYDVNSGAIRIDGMDIRSMTQSGLRKSIGIVLQDPFLFSESIHYNIAYGVPFATDDDVVSASKTANAYNFISHLNYKYQTVLHGQGMDISHGQKQLLTIARAVLLNAPILVFDEATSNIDTRTEILIQKAIANLTKDRTCFIVAHRLSTIKNADKILVLENGKIVEIGKHNELLAKKGAYYKIYNSQFIS